MCYNTPMTKQTNTPGLGADFLPPEVLAALPKLYSTEQVDITEKVIQAKWFSPYNGWRWYAVEIDDDDSRCFGVVHGFEVEWGYFDLNEMQAVKGWGGTVPGVERDVHWKPQTVREAILSGDLTPEACWDVIPPEMSK